MPSALIKDYYCSLFISYPFHEYDSQASYRDRPWSELLKLDCYIDGIFLEPNEVLYA